MGRFGQSYARAINRRYERVGPLFQDRFQAIHVDRDEYLLHLSRYIHLNPLEANLVRRPEEWEFSSYREYLGTRRGTLPQPDDVLRLLASVQRPERVPETDSLRDSYRRFVESGIGESDRTIAHLVPQEE